MTVDTGVKVEGEKCNLDRMSSSCEDLPPNSVGVGNGDGGSECNGDSKDDYVFVNGSDATSDDHVVVEGGNVEPNLCESNADVERKVEGDVDRSDHLKKLDNVVEANGGETKRENGQIVVEEETDAKPNPNGENESENEGRVEGEGVVIGSGDSSKIEGKVEDDVKVRGLEVVEQSDPKSVVDEVKDEESGVEKGDVSNASPLLDDDDKTNILPDLNGVSDMVQNESTVVEAEPQVPHGEIEEERLHLEETEVHEKHAMEPAEKLEDEVREPELVEDTVNPLTDQVTESEPVDGIVPETKPLEADVVHQSHSQEDGVVDTEPANGDVKAPDSEVEELLLDDSVAEKQPQSEECQQQDLQSVDCKELDPVEAEVEVKEQADLDPSEMSGSQSLNSVVDSDAAACDQQQSCKREHHDRDASELTTESEVCQELQTVPGQSEGAELAVSEVDDPAPNNPSQCDEITTELVPEVNGTFETSTVDMQSDESDKPEADNELNRVHEEGKEELIDQAGESVESPVQDQVAEETGLVDVIDKEVNSEELTFEKTVTVDEATNVLKPKSADEAALGEAAVDEEGKDQIDSHVGDHVSEDEVIVPDSSHDSGSRLRSENGELTVPVSNELDVPFPCDSDITKEEEIVDGGSCAGDNYISCSADEPKSHTKMEDSIAALPYLVNGSESEAEPVNNDFDTASKEICDSEDTLKPKISFGSFECVAPFSHSNNIDTHTEVLNRSTELITSHSEYAGGNSEANGVCLTEPNHEKSGAGVVSPEQNNMGEVSASPVEVGADSLNGHNVNPDLVRRPFYYLIRVPRFDDVNLSEQIKLSEMEVVEKTKNRDAVRVEYQNRKANFWELKANYEAARYEERAAHKLMTAKRREIDSAQSLIHFAKNAITVEDVDSQILNMERKIQHETLNLAEEKKLVREIKQLNQQREQLAANSQRQQELHQALDRRVETEEQLKVLKKELDALKDNYAKAEETFKAAKKKYDEESALLNDFRDQFRSVDIVRQEAYVYLQTLKKQAYEKNKLFYHYKDDTKVANEYAGAGEKESLEKHCINQVEKLMELWNKNDEFRKEYVRCNTRSTLRRLRTLDGRSLGPDEEPPSLGNIPDNRVNVVAKTRSAGTVSTLERDFPLVVKKIEDESSKKVIEQNNKTAPAKKRVETTSKNSLAEPSGRIEIEEKEEENKQTKEEEELARKAEQKRKEEEAARLREQRRLEEKAKAQEALERKRRMAEKAQARAEFRARKEAEEKEKEKEKRAKKKGKKKVVASETDVIEPAQLLESSSETIRELEVTEKSVTVTKKSHKPALYTKQVKTTKSISSPPAPLRNRGKRRIPQWAYWLVLAILIVLALIPLGNVDILGFAKLLVPGSPQ